MPLHNGLIYRGDFSWQPSAEPEYDSPPHELPTLVEPWIGATHLAADFRRNKKIGFIYRGGYIIDNRIRSNSPFPGVGSCDLVVALQPDFTKYLAADSSALKTASKSADVAGSNLVPASRIPAGATVPDPLPVTRDVSYFAPQTTYTYFASQRPSGPRFTAVANRSLPRIIRSVIKASLSSGEITFSGFFAPAGIATATIMVVVDRVASSDAQPIAGTPWFRCTDVITRELE